MNVKQLKEILNTYPDDWEVRINYCTQQNLSWDDEELTEVVGGASYDVIYLCGEEKEDDVN